MSCHPSSFGMCPSDREQWVPTPMWTCPVGPPAPLGISSTRGGCRGRCRGVERVLAVLVWGPSGQSGWGQARQGSRCAWARGPGAVLRLCGVSTSQQIQALLLKRPELCVWRPLQPSLLLGSSTCKHCPDGQVVRDGAGQGWWVLRQLLCAPAAAGPDQPVQSPCPRGV